MDGFYILLYRCFSWFVGQRCDLLGSGWYKLRFGTSVGFLVFIVNSLLLGINFFLTFSCLFVLFSYFLKGIVFILVKGRLVPQMSLEFGLNIDHFILMRRWGRMTKDGHTLSMGIPGRCNCIFRGKIIFRYISVQSSILILFDNHFERRFVVFLIADWMTESLLKLDICRSYLFLRWLSRWVKDGYVLMLNWFSIGTSILQLRHFIFEVALHIIRTVLFIKIVLGVGLCPEYVLLGLGLHDMVNTLRKADSCCLRKRFYFLS